MDLCIDITEKPGAGDDGKSRRRRRRRRRKRQRRSRTKKRGGEDRGTLGQRRIRYLLTQSGVIVTESDTIKWLLLNDVIFKL